MKKTSFILLITIPIFVCMLLVSCNLDLEKLKVNQKKPNNFYYTNLLAKNFTLQNSCKCTLLDTTFYKEKDLYEDNLTIVKKFLSSLNKTNFLKVPPQNLPRKPQYKLFFKFSEEQYIIDVYNEQFATIYPWDGTYEMDYIDMTNVYTSYNLYQLCKYLIPRE